MRIINWVKNLFGRKWEIEVLPVPESDHSKTHRQEKGKNTNLTFGKFLREYNQMFRYVNSDDLMTARRLANKRTAGMVHAAIGMSTETGEIWDNLKKHLIYGTDIDEDNLIEELGDIMWYIWKMCAILNVDLTTVMNNNRKKLLKRYANGFSEKAGVERKDKDV